MAVFRDIKVDIPKNKVTIEKQKNGKPALIKYVIEAPYNKAKGYPEPKRTTIGHQCPNSPTQMYPTTQYKNIFPKKWEALTGQKVSPTTKKIGSFNIAQAVNLKTGIKDILDGIYGVQISDSLIECYRSLYSAMITPG